MKVVMIYSSDSDVPYMEPARDYLRAEGVRYDETILSEHRNPDAMGDYLAKLDQSGERAVILAIAGLAASLPGAVVTRTTLPVIGVPVVRGPLGGIDALLSMSQVPGEVPVTTVGLHAKAPLNAAMAAERILRFAGENQESRIQNQD